MNLFKNSSKYLSYSTDESLLKGDFSDIAFPESEEEVKEIIASSVKNNIKITFQGAKTGLLGGAVPSEGRVINFERLNKIGEPVLIGEKGEIFAQAGATFDEVLKAVECKGFHFTVNPTESSATVGGMYSTNAEGSEFLCKSRFSNCVKEINFTDLNGCNYTIKRGEYVARKGSLPLPDGRKIDYSKLSEDLPFEFIKDGTDLIDFLSGKEGYLGAVTSLKLEIEKFPKDIWGIMFFFENENKAVDFIGKINVEATNIKITAGEFYSENALEIIKANLNNPLLQKLPQMPRNAKSAFYLEFESEGEELSEEYLMTLLDEFSNYGNDDDTWAQSEREQIKLFRNIRHALVSLLNEDKKIHSQKLSYRYETDFYLKKQNFKEGMEIYKSILSKYHIPYAVYGSALKNHLHIALLGDVDDENYSLAVKELTEKVVSLKGEPFAKYGVGKIKKDLLKSFLSKEDAENLSSIIKMFDSSFLMNP